MAELIHGRASTYNNYKCRCDECRKAWADYIREGGYVRRYQEKKRQEKLTKQAEPANILEGKLTSRQIIETFITGESD